MRAHDFADPQASALSVSREQHFTTTVENQLQCGVTRLRIPGTVTEGYPEYPNPPRGGCFTVVVNINALRVVAAHRTWYCTERLKPVFTSQHKAELARKNPDLACSGVCAPQPRSCGPAVSCSHCPVCSPGIAHRDTEKPSAHGRRDNGIVHTATQATRPRVDPDSEQAGSVVIEYRAERHASTCVVIDQRADRHASTRVLL